MNVREKTYEEMDYRAYTCKSEFDKTLSVLTGLLHGIVIDAQVNEDEVNELLNWIDANPEFEDFQPFRDIYAMSRELSFEDTDAKEVCEDMLWLCNRFHSNGKFYDLNTLCIQELHGIIHGVLADAVLTDDEIANFQQWLDNHHDILSGTFPYDEIHSLISSILEDNIITENERNTLVAFLSDFIDCSTSYNLSKPELEKLKSEYNVQGICAKNPTINIEGSIFCFTGKSSKYSRSDIKALLESKGATLSGSVSKKTDYLIIGDDGNPCWAFSCYGRKVENAMQLRKNGAHVVIIHESDLWKLL